MKVDNKIILAAAAGLLAGGVLGLLFAPYKGGDTRKKFSEKGKQAADFFNGLVKEKDRKWGKTHAEPASATAVNTMEEELLQ